MKIKNYIFILLILLITIASVNSKQFNYEELKKKSDEMENLYNNSCSKLDKLLTIFN